MIVLILKQIKRPQTYLIPIKFLSKKSTLRILFKIKNHGQRKRQMSLIKSLIIYKISHFLSILMLNIITRNIKKLNKIKNYTNKNQNIINESAIKNHRFQDIIYLPHLKQPWIVKILIITYDIFKIIKSIQLQKNNIQAHFLMYY